MAIVEVKLPELSESANEATMLTWKKHPGDTVEQNEVLVEIETDKVVLEVSAPAAGVLSGILKQEGDVARRDDILATIDTEAFAPRGADKNLGEPSTPDGPQPPTPPSALAPPASAAELDGPCTLSIAIDGTWTAMDFAEFYHALNDLYLFHALAELERVSLREQEADYFAFIHAYAPRAAPARQMMYLGALHRGMASGNDRLMSPTFLQHGQALLKDHERLMVRRCVFASPGITDLTGFGAVLKEINVFIAKMCDLYTGRTARALDNQAKADELERKRREEARAEEIHRETVRGMQIDNAKGTVELLERSGHSQAEIRILVAKIDPAVATLHRLAATGRITDATLLPSAYDAEDGKADPAAPNASAYIG